MMSFAIKQSSSLHYCSLKPFNRVCIWDSTGWHLNKKLKKVIPGDGRKGTDSGCKLQYCYDIKSSSMIHFKVTNGITPDQRYSQENIGKEAKKKDLFIFDLGYYALNTFKSISDVGAYFLSRIEPQTAIFIKEKSEFKRIDLIKWLKKQSGDNTIEIKVFLGKQKIPCRIIASPLPKDQKDARLRKLKKRAESIGKNISPQRKFLAAWNIFITNAPEKYMQTQKVYHFYRLRWSIELLFKQFKSILNINYWNHANHNRLMCEIYGSLIIAVLVSIAHNSLQFDAWRKDKTEISIEKLYKYFSNQAALLFELIIRKKDSYTHFNRFFEYAFRFSIRLKQRSRRTSLQNINILA
jgi:hypothetical protein